MHRVAIVDSGGANIASLLYAFQRLNVAAILTADASFIENADRVVLPGVGATQNAMNRLRAGGLVDVIRNLRQPVLGICLGMQLLCDGSDEEDVECLGIIPGIARKLSPATDCPVPNMGWCETSLTAPHAAFDGIASGSHFYYLHSYALPVSNTTQATAKHAEEFAAVIAKDNFMAAQFHPERSASVGAALLSNFISDRS